MGPRVKVKYVKTKNVFSLFGDVFNNSLSGDIKKINVKLNGKGKDWSEISKSLYGKISLDLKFGMVDGKGLNAVLISYLALYPLLVHCLQRKITLPHLGRYPVILFQGMEFLKQKTLYLKLRVVLHPSGELLTWRQIKWIRLSVLHPWPNWIGF
ncbi:MAG: hypothetical protein Ct9H300mP23_03830 [Nitrospinota bacterium]|nr:MAG: hypothetical protein Ct9H300mP23_03830 [Nitrospinota bacterium]